MYVVSYHMRFYKLLRYTGDVEKKREKMGTFPKFVLAPPIVL